MRELSLQQIVDLQMLTNREYGLKYNCHPSLATMLRKRHDLTPARVDNKLPLKVLQGTVDSVVRIGLRPTARLFGMAVSTIEYRLKQYEQRRRRTD